MANKIIGMPELEIRFRHLGTTALKRGEKGQAILVVKESKSGEPIMKFPTYGSFDDEAQETFSEKNIEYIKDALKMQPKELLVVRLFEEDSDNLDVDTFDMDGDGELELNDDGQIELKTLGQALKFVGTKASRNCWIAVADITADESEELALFVSEENKYNRKRYKAIVYQYEADDKHVVNYTTEAIKMKDEDEMRDGVEALPMLLGAIAAQPLDTGSLVGKIFTDIEYVIEPEDGDKAVDSGELFFVNDEGDVRVARAVNSLTTIEQNMTHDMKYILVVEVMDLIYSDVIAAWSDYKGRYKNNLDNQMLLLSALNTYYRQLEADMILDENFDNRVEIDTQKQRLANIPIYGEEEVGGWSDNRVMEMTVGTNVYLKSRIKISNAMEDLFLDIFI